jgi:hypothetical protein
VEAIAPDSTTYITLTDSSGRFVLTHVTPGKYSLRGYLDANNNRALDPREAWDSTSVTVQDSVRSDIYVFQHDTVGPRMASVDVRDSLTLRVSFDKPIDPRQTIDTALFSLKTSDSAVVPILLARGAREYEMARSESAAADTTARARDSLARIRPGFPIVRRPVVDTAAKRLPTLARPIPVSEVILQVFPPLRAGSAYRLAARGIRGLLGATQASERTVTVPKPPAAPLTPADSIRRARPPASSVRW